MGDVRGNAEAIHERNEEASGFGNATGGKRYCMGILHGICLFRRESHSEYKDWADDAPREFFQSVINTWKESTTNSSDIAQVEDFVRRELSDL